MPVYPSVEPSATDFPEQPALETLLHDDLKHGLAPWRHDAINTPSNLARGAGDLATDASPIVFGGGVFGHDMYNTSDTLASDLPLRTVRLALRYGINAFDTSPYYFPSEFTLGSILARLRPEFPRESYFLITKCGRYGPDHHHFDYSAEKIDSSVRGSCRRLGTEYLDVVLTHDAEFVCDKVGRSHHDGWESGIVSGLVKPQDVGVQQTRDEVMASLGLAPGLEAASKVHGKGDAQFLEAVQTLFKLKDQGIVKRVGISGYPLPVLLRLSRLVATTAPYRPLDVVLNYSNHCLHSDVLEGWKSLFAADPRGDASDALPDLTWTAPLLLNGSPFSMGLLTDGTPPPWHPASDALKAATKEASRELVAKGDSLTLTALAYGLRGSEVPGATGGPQLRTLVGLSHPDHVHSAIEAYRVLSAGATKAGTALFPAKAADEDRLKAYAKQAENEAYARDLFAQRGVREWSWASGL